jgi:hypothetical protein
MIDVNNLLRTWLLTDPLNNQANPVIELLTNLFSPGAPPPNNTPNRIYSGHLPPGFDPTFGPGIVVRVGSGTSTGTAGGSAEAEAPILNPRMQISVFGDGNDYTTTREVYRSIFDWIHGKTNVDLGDAGYVLTCLEQVEGQDIPDAHTGKATVVSYWRLRTLAN